MNYLVLPSGRAPAGPAIHGIWLGLSPVSRGPKQAVNRQKTHVHNGGNVNVPDGLILGLRGSAKRLCALSFCHGQEKTMTPANRPNRRKRRLWGPVTALAAAALVAPPAWASAPPAWGSAKATGAATLTAAVGAGARAVAGGEAAPVAASTQQAWPSAGQNNDDTRNAAAEH